MTAGETLLKITDYPFIYSITLVILAAHGVNLYSKDVYPYLAAAGVIGTFLAILDPFGKAVKYSIIFSELVNIRLLGNEGNEEWTYVKAAFHTRPMEIEKDKIVSMIYFLFIVGTSIILINSSTSFTNNFAFIINLNPTCNVDCQKTLTVFTLEVIMVIIFIVTTWNAVRLINKANIVAAYLSCIGSSRVPSQSVEGISHFIESGDWKTAEYWQKKIHEDIEYNRGQKENVITAAEKVYKPLSAEFTRIKTGIDNITINKTYPTISFGAWTAMKQSLAHLIVDDSKFRERMDNFQNKTSQHDALLVKNHEKITDTINRMVSIIYGKNITNTSYFIGTAGASMIVNLVTCAFCNVHPRDYDSTREPYSINLEWVEDNTQRREIMVSPEDIARFNNGWNEIKNEIENEPDYKKMKEILEEIRKENTELLKISTERFMLQYKV